MSSRRHRRSARARRPHLLGQVFLDLATVGWLVRRLGRIWAGEARWLWAHRRQRRQRRHRRHLRPATRHG
jgi:hypothetical protein